MSSYGKKDFELKEMAQDQRRQRNKKCLESCLITLVGFRIRCSELLGTAVIAEAARWEVIISM